MSVTFCSVKLQNGCKFTSRAYKRESRLFRDKPNSDTHLHFIST